jgi:hypothetical protein
VGSLTRHVDRGGAISLSTKKTGTALRPVAVPRPMRAAAAAPRMTVPSAIRDGIQHLFYQDIVLSVFFQSEILSNRSPHLVRQKFPEN